MNAFPDFVISIGFSLAVALAIYYVARRGLHRLGTPSPRTCDRILYLSVALYILIFGALSVLRHLSFNGFSDLGLYDQLVWNSMRGRLFQNTLLEDANFYLGKSFSPILLALVPLYALWPDPVALLITQTIALAATAFPIYWFAREQLGHPLALVVVWALLLSPTLESVNLTDVHGIAFAAPVLAFATCFLFRHQYKPFLVCLGLALLIREEIALIVIIFGVYIFLFERRRRFGFAICLSGCMLTVLLLALVIPFFHGPAYASQFYYFGGGVTAQAQSRYTYLGHNIPEILWTMITRPQFVLGHLLTPEKIAFVFHLLVPLCFLPLAGFEASMLALPTLGYSLLSDNAFQYSIRSFYDAPMIPFLFFGTVLGARRIVDWRRDGTGGERAMVGPRRARELAVGAGLLTSALLGYYFVGRGPLARDFEPRYLEVNRHTAVANQLVAMIPPDASVAAQTEYVAHLSARQLIYDFPGFPDYRGVDYLVADTLRVWYGLHRTNWDEILATGYFEVIAQDDGVMIAQRRAIAQPLDVRYGDAVTLVGITVVPDAPLRGGTILRPIVYWRAEKNIAERYWVRIWVEDAQGHVWAEQDREPQEGKLPTTLWETGKITADQFSLNLPPTMPSGDYKILIALHALSGGDLPAISNGQEKVLGSAAIVTSVTIQKDKSSVTASELRIEQPLFVDMEEMRFLGYVLPQDKLRAGDRLQLGIYWRARAKPAGDYIVAVQLRDQMDRILFEQSARPANGVYPTTLWDPGEVLLDWHDFNVPQGLPAGDYRIVVLLRDDVQGDVLGRVDLFTLFVSR